MRPGCDTHTNLEQTTIHELADLPWWGRCTAAVRGRTRIQNSHIGTIWIAIWPSGYWLNGGSQYSQLPSKLPGCSSSSKNVGSCNGSVHPPGSCVKSELPSQQNLSTTRLATSSLNQSNPMCPIVQPALLFMIGRRGWNGNYLRWQTAPAAADNKQQLTWQRPPAMQLDMNATHSIRPGTKTTLAIGMHARSLSYVSEGNHMPRSATSPNQTSNPN